MQRLEELCGGQVLITGDVGSCHQCPRHGTLVPNAKSQVIFATITVLLAGLVAMALAASPSASQGLAGFHATHRGEVLTTIVVLHALVVAMTGLASTAASHGSAGLNGGADCLRLRLQGGWNWRHKGAHQELLGRLRRGRRLRRMADVFVIRTAVLLVCASAVAATVRADGVTAQILATLCHSRGGNCLKC